jgi:hypothetical protein
VIIFRRSIQVVRRDILRGQAFQTYSLPPLSTFIAISAEIILHTFI